MITGRSMAHEPIKLGRRINFGRRIEFDKFCDATRPQHDNDHCYGATDNEINLNRWGRP